MEDEFDELSMGPRDGDVEKLLQSGDTTTMLEPQLRRSQSSGSAPPSSLFNSIPSSSEESRPIPSAAKTNSFVDDDEPPAIARSHSQSPESRRIRQEALRMLEVADDQLTESGSYSVYRTKTGGFSAEPKSFGQQKRVPAALSGFNFASSRNNLARPFRDDPYADTDSPAATSQECYEFGEDTAVLDVGRMESRSAATTAEEGTSNSWSSRYSIDNTLLALSGGSVSSSKLLDKMDKDNRRSARNLFPATPAQTAEPQIFGSGFSFRQKHVFGQQDVTAKSDKNLKTVWMDATPVRSMSPVAPARSWQEQFHAKRQRRRNILIASVCAVMLFFILIVSVTVRNQNSSSENSNRKPIISDESFDENSVTFYVTSDVPLHSVRDDAFMEDLNDLSWTAEFLVHLGDIQLAENTQCKAERYTEVAAILKRCPILVLVVPGEEDWANCPDQQEAWGHWVDNFLQFEKFQNHDLEIVRMDDQRENFAFLSKGVLFVGLHETNGRIDDIDELRRRNSMNVDWVKTAYEIYGTDARALVLFANGRPAIRENDSFYIGIGDFLFDNKIPTAYIHANHANGKELKYHPYEIDGMEHVVAIQSSLGENHEPLRINVGFDATDPFIVG